MWVVRRSGRAEHAGKTTVLHKLVPALQAAGLRVLRTKEPSSGFDLGNEQIHQGYDLARLLANDRHYRCGRGFLMAFVVRLVGRTKVGREPWWEVVAHTARGTRGQCGNFGPERPLFVSEPALKEALQGILECRTGIRVVVMSSPDGVTAGVDSASTTQQNG
jgi:hypothetical protein